MEDNDQADHEDVGEEQIEQDTSDNFKKHETSQSAESCDGGSINDENVTENTAPAPGGLPQESSNHSTTPGDPATSRGNDQAVKSDSPARSDIGHSSYGLIVENEGGTEFDLVMVHGLGQDRRSAWTDDDSPETTWMGRAYPTARILLYGYDTDSNHSSIFTISGIVKEATRLLRQLDALRRDNHPKRSLVFVSHGLGGLLVKAVLALAFRLPDKYAHILDETTCIVFMGYTIGHKPSSVSVLQENILALLLQDFGEDKYNSGRLMSYVHSLAQTVEEVHANFVHTKMFTRAEIINAVPGSFDQSQADELLRRSHAVNRICYEPGAGWVYSFKSFSGMTHEQLSRDHEEWLYGNLDVVHRKALNDFISQAPPFYPSSACINPDSVPELEELFKIRGSRILHMRCNNNTKIVTEYVGEYFDSKSDRKEVLQFHFDPHDVRYASLDSMLRAFLSQLAARGLVSREYVVERMMYYSTTLGVSTTRDLLFSLARFISGHGGQLIFVIGGLEDCEGSVQEFIEMFSREQRDEDACIRCAILTNIEEDGHITEMLSKLPCDVIREWIVDDVSSFVPEYEVARSELSTMPQKLLQFFNHEVSSTLSQLISTLNTANDNSLGHILISWLRSTKTPARVVGQTLELLQLETQRSAPERVFVALLSSVPPEKQTWAKHILRWIAFSLRPLRAEELCIVSQLTSQHNEKCGIADILCWFGGLLRVEYDEVRFAHTSLRPWLVRQAGSATDPVADEMWCHFDADSASHDHLDILKLCLMYVRSPHEHSTGGFWPTKHVFPYAWQYWTTHYLLAKPCPESSSEQETALTIFRDSAAFHRWIHVYRDLADPLTLFDREALSPTSIAAHFGLDDLLRLLICKEESDWDVLPPLIEAARRGHLSTFNLLKQEWRGSFSIADDRVGQLVEIAASCGQTDVLQEAMMLLPKTKTDSECQGAKPAWLTPVLIRACWMDNKDLAEVVLELGADINAVMPPSPGATEAKITVSMLSIAIMANSIGIANLLLDRGFDLNADTTMTGFLAWATREMAELLIEKGWNFKSNFHKQKGPSPLQDACSWGNNAVVEVLLRHETNFTRYIDPDFGQPLLVAVKGQQIKNVRTLLNHSVDVNVTDDEGNALYHAVANGNVDICRLLLEYEKEKIDVDYCAPNSKPPLVKALFIKNEDEILPTVRLLLQNGADVKRRENSVFERTPLLTAAAQLVVGIDEVVMMLLSYGSEIDAKDSEGWTSLYTAAYYNNISVGRLLIEAKADLFATTKEDNRSPLHGAYDSPDFIKLLLDNGLDPMQKDKAGTTPLRMCAEENLIKSLEIMLEASQDSEEAILTDALTVAFENSHQESVRLLLDHGADVNHLQEATNQTLISRSMQDNNESMTRLLLEYRPDLDLVDHDENTALHYVDENTSVTSVRSLVNATAKLDVFNKRRQSPLTVAVESRNWDVVRYLVSKPAVLPILNVPSYSGTPLHLACRLGTLDIVRCLVERGADPNSHCEGIGNPLSQVCIRPRGDCISEKEDIIRYLLDKSDRALAPTSSGSSGPMHHASRTCSATIITTFIENGADKLAGDEMGRRPLHLACYNSLDVVQALDVPDEEFATRDKAGRVPLHYAVMAAYTESEIETSPSLLEYVLERTKAAGLGIDVTDNDGWTPLLWSGRRSIMFGDFRPRLPLETFRQLVENGADPAALGQVRGGNVTSSGPDKAWSFMDIALYHRNAVLLSHLADAVGQLPNISGKAPPNVDNVFELSVCDYCYLPVFGEYFECDYCVNAFDLCFKCYGSKDVLHPAHDFVQKSGDKGNSDEQADVQPMVDDMPDVLIEELEHEGHMSGDDIGDEAASELSSADG